MGFLTLQNVSKGYGVNDRRTEVLRGINLEVDPGEFVAIVGFSGAGKTTLVNLVAGLIQPESGRITLNGLEIREPGPDRGIVFQNYSLLPWLTVFENILLAVDQCFPNWSAADKIGYTERYVAMVNLTAARDKRPPLLSGGMRQRVAVARALAMDPQILLLDEPLSALDALTRSTLREEISRIWRESKKTVLLITNDVDEGIYLADRIIPLTSGPAATLGPSFKVDFDRPRDWKDLRHQPRFRAIRREVVEFLLLSRQQPGSQASRTPLAPDLKFGDRFGSRLSLGDPMTAPTPAKPQFPVPQAK